MRCILILPFLAACPGEEKGDFGDAKPTVDDGRIVQPVKAPDGPPDFANALAMKTAFDKGTGKLAVTLEIKPGFHAYAPGEAVGLPVDLVVENKNGWSAEKASIPMGREKDLGPALGKSVILEGTVELSTVVKGGNGDIAGAVKAQICTDKACDRPKTHTFSVPTT